MAEKGIMTRFHKSQTGQPVAPRKSQDVGEALNNFSLDGMSLLWRVATDPTHPWHKKHGFEALKTLVNKATPARKELTGEGGGPVEFSLTNLFHSNSLEALPEPTGEVVEVETIKNDSAGRTVGEAEDI
jgi:hypothetical protein